MFTVDLTVLEPDSTADYEWAFSDGGKAFGEMTTYQFPQEGMYEVCLYGYNYCGSDTICQEIEIGGSSIDQQEESSIRLFPNPASDYFQLQLPVALDELQLYDLYGRQQFVSFNAKGRVDVSSLNRGIYFIQYRLQDGKRGSLRVTVQ
jgi:PKD repeat protein